MGASLTEPLPPTTVPSTGIFSPARARTTSPISRSLIATVRSPLSARTKATWGTEPISPLMDARARSVFNSAMNSAIKMMTMRIAPATVSPPKTATVVAMVTKISVPTFRSLTRSVSPFLTSGYRPTATAPNRTGSGTRLLQ